MENGNEYLYPYFTTPVLSYFLKLNTYDIFFWGLTAYIEMGIGKYGKKETQIYDNSLLIISIYVIECVICLRGMHRALTCGYIPCLSFPICWEVYIITNLWNLHLFFCTAKTKTNNPQSSF